MGDDTKIAWADATWNIVTGCTKISVGCLNCYAEKMAKRLQGMGQENYRDGFSVRCHEHMLKKPLDWKRPRNIFLCSMGDLFHHEVPDDFIDKVFEVMFSAKHHRFLVLTKRPNRMRDYVNGMNVKSPDNIWYGTSVCAKSDAGNISALADLNSRNRFVSFEPLVESVGDLDLTEIRWVIVGGESGAGARSMEMGWVKEIMKSSDRVGASFFMKQMGSWWGKWSRSSSRKGENPSEWPEWMRRQEFPWKKKE